MTLTKLKLKMYYSILNFEKMHSIFFEDSRNKLIFSKCSENLPKTLPKLISCFITENMITFKIYHEDLHFC